MLEILAPQAAISLDAARLYKELAEENTRRALAEAEPQQARADMAHRTHLTVMGELAASIAHETSRPLTNIVTSAEASVRWLRCPQPDVGEALFGLQAIRDQGVQASEIVKALRALAKQASAAQVAIDPDEAVRSVVRLIATEIDAHGMQIETHLQQDCCRRHSDGAGRP